MNKINKILFDMLDYSIDDDGFIIRSNGERVLSESGGPVPAEDVVGIVQKPDGIGFLVEGYDQIVKK